MNDDQDNPYASPRVLHEYRWRFAPDAQSAKALGMALMCSFFVFVMASMISSDGEYAMTMGWKGWLVLTAWGAFGFVSLVAAIVSVVAAVGMAFKERRN